MHALTHPTPAEIRAARQADPDLRERDLAGRLQISEAALIAAHIGHGVTRISADCDRIIAAAMRLGEVMALTRNASCVIEKIGVYDGFRPGPHAALVVNEHIDLRLFPARWVHAYAVEKPVAGGLRRSFQVFDAAGDAVHKIFLRYGSRVEEWPALVEALRHDDQDDSQPVAPRQPAEPARADAAKAQRLRAEWDRLTDTHQFLQMLRKLGMNRLGAYRIAGAPYVRPLALGAIDRLMSRAAASGLPIMVFVGNPGCIEIHTGPVRNIRRMGPWLNVLDPGFDLHLRSDHIAEVWQVTKSTRRGDAISVEAFDRDGMLIVQVFGVLADPEAAAGWNALVAGLEPLTPEATR